jgi:hypothetical protein
MRQNIHGLTDEAHWRQAKNSDLASRLKPADPRIEWKQRTLEIAERVLHGLAPELQAELLRPYARELGEQLRDCDWRDGDFHIDRFEVALRLAVEQLSLATNNT